MKTCHVCKYNYIREYEYFCPKCNSLLNESLKIKYGHSGIPYEEGCMICGEEHVENHHIRYNPEEIVLMCKLHHFCFGLYCRLQIINFGLDIEGFYEKWKIYPEEVELIIGLYPQFCQKEPRPRKGRKPKPRWGKQKKIP